VAIAAAAVIIVIEIVIVIIIIKIIIIIKYINSFNNFTINPFMLTATFLTVFNANYLVRLSIH
jgi:hypothetical protein